MSQSHLHNRRIVLASRPKGAPKPENFRLETVALPEPGEGQALLRTVWLSLDPYMRGRMSDGPSYAAPVPVDGVMVGGVVARVERSRNPKLAEGSWVVSSAGWQDYSLTDGSGLLPVDPAFGKPSFGLGVLGMPGFTAYMGLTDIGKPREGETVVVGAATGAVGSVVGQIAKILGCRVVGIAGGADKCRYAVDQLGFDACIDHKSPTFPKDLAAACPRGIDVYFENVGGAVLEAVVPLLNTRARVPVCGLIANYNADRLPEGPDKTPLLLRAILTKRLTVRGFIIFDDYGPRFPEFLAKMGPWVHEGRVKYREDLVQGLENAPQAFMGLLEGKNFGKLLVQVGPETLTP